jgi:hypothetical protein
LERLLQSVFDACHPSRCQCVRSAFDGISLVPRLAAVATANPDICAHIPANQRVNQVAAPLRDWCFYTVAFYTQDIRVCDRMTLSAAEATVLAVKAAGVRPEIAEQMGLHAECAVSRNAWGLACITVQKCPATTTRHSDYSQCWVSSAIGS